MEEVDGRGAKAPVDPRHHISEDLEENVEEQVAGRLGPLLLQDSPLGEEPGYENEGRHVEEVDPELQGGDRRVVVGISVPEMPHDDAADQEKLGVVIPGISFFLHFSSPISLNE